MRSFTGGCGAAWEGGSRIMEKARRVVSPAAVSHVWRNPNIDEELHLLSEPQATLNLEVLIGAVSAIARDLKCGKTGILERLLRLAALTDEARTTSASPGWYCPYGGSPWRC